MKRIKIIMILMITFMSYHLSYSQQMNERIKTIQFFNNSSSIVESINYFYDKDGNIIKSITTGEENQLVGHCEFVYKNNLLDKMIKYNAKNEIMIYYTYKNDESGHETGRATYDNKNSIITYEIFEKDSSNRPMLMTKYDKSNNIITITTITFINPLKIKISIHDAQKNLKEYSIIEYKDNKLIKSIEEFDYKNIRTIYTNVLYEEGLISRLGRKFFHY